MKQSISEKINKAIYEHNRRVHIEGMSEIDSLRLLNYDRYKIEEELYQEKGFRMDIGYSFLYPTVASSAVPEFPETYEGWREMMDDKKRKYFDKNTKIEREQN